MSDKKSRWLIVLAAALIIMQAFSLSRIRSMQQEMTNLRNQMVRYAEDDSRYLANISSQIQQQLEKQASIIDSCDYSFSSLDAAALTVDCTFTVAPKQLENDTGASLELNGKTLPMERQGNSFALTVPLSIFDNVRQPRLVLESAGVRRQESLDMGFDVRYEALPEMWASLDRQGGATTFRAGENHGGTYYLSGNLSVDVVYKTFPGASGSGLSNLRLAVLVDGKEVWQQSKEELFNNSNVTGGHSDGKSFHLNIDKEIEFPLLSGQELCVAVQGEDAYGITHRTVVDQLSVDANGEPDWGDHTWLTGQDTLLDSAGNVLWQPEYDK